MEGFAAQKLNEFETGKIGRRKLIEQLTLAATTLYAADSAGAQGAPPQAQTRWRAPRPGLLPARGEKKEHVGARNKRFGSAS